MVDLLSPGFADRIAGSDSGDVLTETPDKTDRRVSWANHFDPESTLIRMEEERKVRMGDPPTSKLTADFRERFEDMVWAVLNSPEFSVIP